MQILSKRDCLPERMKNDQQRYIKKENVLLLCRIDEEVSYKVSLCNLS